MEKSTKNILGLYGGILAFYGSLFGASMLVENMHKTRPVNVDGQQYFISKYDGKTEVSKPTPTCLSTLVDNNSDGEVDFKYVGCIASMPPMRFQIESKPTLEDKILFDKALKINVEK